jgi:hypothetical protein
LFEGNYADDATLRLANNPQGGDEKLAVRFLLLDVENEAKSRAAGYPVYDQVEGIHIRAPGNRDEILRKALPKDKARFPRQYAAFKAGMEEPTSGLPLREWPAIGKAQAEVLIYQHGIRTVEQLAGVSDGNVDGLGHGALALRKKARDYIERAKSGAPTAQLEAALREANNKIEVMARSIETLQKQAGTVVAPIVDGPVPAPVKQKRTRNRKPKEGSQHVEEEQAGGAERP